MFQVLINSTFWSRCAEPLANSLFCLSKGSCKFIALFLEHSHKPLLSLDKSYLFSDTNSSRKFSTVHKIGYGPSHCPQDFTSHPQRSFFLTCISSQTRSSQRLKPLLLIQFSNSLVISLVPSRVPGFTMK